VSGELARREIGQVVGRLTTTGIDRGERRRLLTRLTALLADGARAAGARAAVTGGWLADVIADIAPSISVRDLPTLVEQHDGLTGPGLADELVRRASLATAGVGAAGGALTAAAFAAPPSLVVAPLKMAAETVAVVAIELKLVAELHVVHGRAPLAPASQVAAAYLQSWASRTPVAESGAGLAAVVGAVAKVQLRRRVTRRLISNLSTMVPFLAGAVAGAEVNRRETRGLGEAMLKGLRRR